MSDKKDYEVAIDAFLAAQEVWQKAEEELSSGAFLRELMLLSEPRAMAEWQARWNDLRNKLEDYNAKRKSAADALRQAVVLSPTQWRGPDGKGDSIRYGGFEVNSVTKRSFDAESLFTMIQKHGLGDRLLGLKTLNKDGQEVPLVQHLWSIDYDGVLNWLRANKLNDVITGAYDEKESTPQVKGPKEMSFMGDTVKRP